MLLEVFKLDKQEVDNEIVFEIKKEFDTKSKRDDISLLDVLENRKIKTEIVSLIQKYSSKSDLASQFLEIIPLYFDNTGNWWRWRSARKCWEITDEIDILNLVEGCSGANIVSSKERTEIINAIKQAARRNKPEEVQKTWIQFNDEIIDIKTGKRFEATPKYFVTNPIPWRIGKLADTPNMDRIFTEWVGEKRVKTLYQIMAYSLIPDYPIHRLFCFIGGGMNGKGCFLRAEEKFIGKHNICSTELDTLLNSRFEVTRLHKKLVCVMGETNFKELSKTSILKKLTGGDLIGFEYKNKTPFEDYNYAKIIIATNSLPETNDKTIGFYRRWLIIDFPNRFSEKKDILNDIPDYEYENLALKCIGILIELLEKREFENEGSIEERMKLYEDKSNPFDKFFEECIEEDFDSCIWKFEFNKRFSEWCKINRYREYSENSITRRMSEKNIQQVQKTTDFLLDGQKKVLRAWSGIRWKK